MSLRLRRLRLAATTTSGTFGTDLSFEDGLVVLRAENSSGKSTCIQGIIFALGLEGMLSASREVPLAHAMTTAIVDPRSDREVTVTESYVEVTAENDRGDVRAFRRYAKHERFSKDLVRVSVLGADGKSTGFEDYFVRRPGAAARNAGFHNMLAKFIGWELPIAQTFDDTEVPLYLETIFPLFVVEQKRGWSAVQAQTPTQFRIRDVRKRALDFVVNLRSAEVATQIRALERQSSLLTQEWHDRRASLIAEASAAGAVIRNLSSRPVLAGQADASPFLSIPKGDTWIDIEAELRDAKGRLQELDSLRTGTSGGRAPEARLELNQVEDRLRKLIALAARESDDLSSHEMQRSATTDRLSDLETDLRRHQDLRLIRQLGGVESDRGLLPHECPTCHQGMPETVLDVATAPRVMTIDESIKHIEEERTLLRDMQNDLNRVVETKQARLEALRRGASEERSRIAALRNTLIASDATPSEADVEARVAARASVARLTAASQALANHEVEFEQLSNAWTSCRNELERLRATDLSAMDADKRRALQRLLSMQLTDYHLGSLAVDSVGIGEDTWLPTHEGFELGFDLSASDMIRLIWAYLLGLMELSREFEMNHIGLLIMDEPRQQMAAPVSFEAFIRRASASRGHGQQVIVATSEERGQLDKMLQGFSAQIHDFGLEKVLRPEE
jgi:hypothetical protein